MSGFEQQHPAACALARQWGRDHVIVRPSTGEVFISPSRGVGGDDYITIGRVSEPDTARLLARVTRAVRRLLVALVFLVSPAAAQTPTPVFPADVFYFEVNASNQTAANAMTASIEANGAIVSQGQVMVCGPAPASPPPSVWHPCETTIPALEPGLHTIRIQTTEVLYGRPIASAWSDPITIEILARRVVRNVTVRRAEIIGQ